MLAQPRFKVPSGYVSSLTVVKRQLKTIQHQEHSSRGYGRALVAVQEGMVLQ